MASPRRARAAFRLAFGTVWALTSLAVVVVSAAPASATHAPFLVAVVPDTASGVEGFALSVGEHGTDRGDWGNEADDPHEEDAGDVDASPWAVTDGEGVFPLPEMPAGVHWFASDPKAWRALGMAEAWPFSGPRLADAGDELEVVSPDGTVADAFAWGRGATQHMAGSVAYRSEGLVHVRNGGPDAWVDTDRAEDWVGPRVHRVGQSRLDATAFQVERVTLYASPDSSHEVLTTILAEARTRIALHVYGLRSPSLTDAVVDAAARGVKVDVLVSKSPVGLTGEGRHETAWALERIVAAGGRAWLAGTQRYEYHHLKVLVADDAVAVQSENWVPSGVPSDPTWGNRGWGAVVHDAEVASWFAAWMAADRAAWDTEPFDLPSFDPTYRDPVRFPPRQGDHVPVPPLVVKGPVRVVPFVSPDDTGHPGADPVAAVASAARQRLLVQQLDLRTEASNALGWRAPDVLAMAIVGAATNGAAVRVQAAEPFSSGDDGNADALAWLRVESGGRVRTMQGAETPVATIHNKGIVADDVVVVGSMNGNHHSRSENREAGLIIHSAPAADFFADLFEDDWGGRSRWAAWGGGWGADAGAPAAPTLLVCVLLGAFWCIRRRGSSWPSS